MSIPLQVPLTSLSRASNAAHAEHMERLARRMRGVEIGHPAWQAARQAFEAALAEEQRLVRRSAALADNDLSDRIAEADALRDRLMSSVAAAARAFGRGPEGPKRDAALAVGRELRQHRVHTRAGYAVESGELHRAIEGLRTMPGELGLLGLASTVDALDEANETLRRLVAERSELRGQTQPRALRLARRATDEARRELLFYTNACAALGLPFSRTGDGATDGDPMPGGDGILRLIAILREDLEYFTRHDMPDPHRVRDAGGK